MQKPALFWLHFNKFDASRFAGDIWTIRQHNRNCYVKRVVCEVPLVTIYRGHEARQPRAYLKGIGVVRIQQGHAIISKE